jgi:hypothetical protein
VRGGPPPGHRRPALTVGRHRRSSAARPLGSVRPRTAMIRAPDPAERSAVDQWVATPPEGSLRRVTAAEDRHPYRTGSFADGRPGGGRKTPQGTSPGSRSPSAWSGSVPTAASTCPPGWRGERSSGQRSAVQTFERLNVRTFQRPTPLAGRVGSGVRRATQRIAVLRSSNRDPQSPNPQSSRLVLTVRSSHKKQNPPYN